MSHLSHRMKTVITSSLTGALTISALVAGTAANADLMELCPYIGADYYQTWMRARHDYKQIFPNMNSYGLTFYLGTRFHQNFAIEAGYDWSDRRKKDWVLNGGQTFFGSVITETFSGTTRVRRTGAHVDFVAFLPMLPCFELAGYFGVGWVEPRVHKALSIFPVVFIPDTSAIASISAKGKAVVRLGIGGNYMVSEVVGVRGKIGWEATQSINIKGNDIFHTLLYKSRGFKNTTALSLGAFVKI